MTYIGSWSLVSIHLLAGRTTALDALRCMGTNAHKQSQPSQQKPACSQQSRTCWSFARGCEACAAICCGCDLWEPITQDTKQIFCPSEKKSKAENTKYNDFRKVVVFNSIVSLSQRTLTMFAGVVALGCQHLAMLALVMECYNSYKHRVFNQGIIDIQEWKLDQFFFVCWQWQRHLKSCRSLL